LSSNASEVQFEEGTEPTAYEPYRDPDTYDPGSTTFYLNRDPIGYFSASGDLAPGSELLLPENNVPNKTVTVFSCRVDALDKVYIGKKKDSTEAPYILIDNTNVEIHGYLENVSTRPHGLTIGDNLLVRIETGEDRYIKRVTVTSGTDTFEVAGNIRWTCDKGGAFVRSEGSTLTNCVLTWTSRNIAKPVWVFGDSYVSHEYETRWPFYLFADGYGDITMLNGFAGEDSADALVSLKNLLAIGRPQYIVWALGMNDKDGTDTASSRWQTCFNEVEALCSTMNIKLIACTIPQVVSTKANNAHKNAIIRASGHRYIDFEEAVVADTTTGEWYTGLLSSDDLHPSIAGAKALYYRLLCDFPEIMTL
jgi:lysophospholipase L1-like esterase